MTKFRNQDREVAFIQVDEDVALERYSEFTKTCYNINIIVQTTGGDASSLNVKTERPNKTLANITRALLLNSIHKKELWCFAYHYAIWTSRRNENRLCGGVP